YTTGIGYVGPPDPKANFEGTLLMSLEWTIPLLLLLAFDAGDNAQDYLQKVRPVLERRCYSCHGVLHQKGGLRLDTAAALLTGGDSGPAVVRDNPAAGLLLEKITETDPELRMPPDGEPLTTGEIDAIRKWISAGAVAPDGEIPPADPRDHWAYRPPVRPQVPVNTSPKLNPIDAFLDAARKSKGLTASPPVSRDLWLRRVTLDLIGLPPTREDLHAFRADTSDKARESVVDRLLASPAHGERWARHWMDIWRYSDWYGLGQELRFSHYHIWRWRDWIVESLNSGVGYNQMIVEMLAADEVSPEDPNALRATGFLVRNWDTFSRNKWLDMTIEHTSRAFLGITMQCARCHDHKFDPIAQADYYRMRAVFEPYQIRIDRVPGQPDRTKDGIARTFDDYHDTPTYLFVRGDENLPDKSQILTAGTPEVLGGTFDAQPVTLPVYARNPNKQAFIINEAVASAESAVAGAMNDQKAAQAAVEQAMMELKSAEETLHQVEAGLQSAANPEDTAEARAALSTATETCVRVRKTAADATSAVDRANAVVVAAEKARDALQAVLAVEKLEDGGVKESNPDVWAKAARAALSSQRQQALTSAISAELAAQHAVESASAAVDGLIAASHDPQDDAQKAALAKATAAVVDARTRLKTATDQRAAAENACSQPLTTDYQPRPLEFPRAKVTYRDTPSNAPYAATSTGRRLALARWITDRGNPLTARVAVNQIWTRHFGEPLVRSVFDFGLRTPRPVQHELLDWLAVEFMESGWDMKRLHKLIVTSQTYQMQSSPTGAEDPNLLIDPDNHYYWRMNPRRMEAEVIRDSLLLLAGRLDSTQGGPDLPIAMAEDGTRRSIYYRYARNDRMLFLTMFDAPSAEECYRRHETIVPQQALALFNSKLAFDRADEIAQAITARVGESSPVDFVHAAFELLLGRAPTEHEQRTALEGLESLMSVEQVAEAPAAQTPPSSGDEKILTAQQANASARERASAAFIHVLFNHNDFVTIR
ncbi:MAG: DUF1553 domain-containing protein, partial [Planctomycetaceae bacterium]|nr:DUF1553 domain-containing protein [Planctomycetaceae bacterium]